MRLSVKEKLSRLKEQQLSWPLIVFFLVLNIYSPIITKATTALFILYLLAINFRQLNLTIKCAFKAWPLLLFIIWEIVSVFFSAIPKLSLNIILNDFAIYCLALLLAQHSINRNIYGSLKFISVALISSSIIYSVLFFNLAVHADGMKAFYHQKNFFGLVMALCTLILAFSSEKRRVDYLFMILGLLLTVFSQSKTSLNVTMIIVVAWLLISMFRYQFGKFSSYTQGFLKLMAKALPAFFYSLIVLMLVFSDEVATYLIQNIPYDAFTGRGELWITVLTRTQDDLMTGIGLGVFWGADRASEIARTLLYEQTWVQELRAADGGYVDMIGALGFVGLGLLFSSYVYIYRVIFSNLNQKIIPIAFAIITFFIIHDIFETDMFKFINIPWFLFLIMYFYLTFIRFDAKNTPQPKFKNQ